MYADVTFDHLSSNTPAFLWVCISIARVAQNNKQQLLEKAACRRSFSGSDTLLSND